MYALKSRGHTNTCTHTLHKPASIVCVLWLGLIFTYRGQDGWEGGVAILVEQLEFLHNAVSQTPEYEDQQNGEMDDEYRAEPCDQHDQRTLLSILCHYKLLK